MLCLRRRGLLGEPGTVVTEVTLNHEFLMSSYHTASERALASMALDMFSGQEGKVLVGGLGLGYTTAECLACERVGQVEALELLPQTPTDLQEKRLFLGKLRGASSLNRCVPPILKS